MAELSTIETAIFVVIKLFDLFLYGGMERSGIVFESGQHSDGLRELFLGEVGRINHFYF